MRYKWILLTVLFAPMVLTAGLASAGGPPIDPPGLERAMAAQEAHTNALLAVKGVVGTAVGLADGQPVIKIFTESAGIAGLPKTLDGVPVQVQVTGKIVALHHQPGHSGGPPGSGGGGGVDPKSRFDRPVPIGVSSGTELLITDGTLLFCTVGTLGARVVDNGGTPEYPDDDIFFALSNAHVYAQEGSTTWSADASGPQSAAVGDAILQPGRVDAGTGCTLVSGDSIGRLDDWEEIKFPASACDASLGASDPDCNIIDAAIARSTPADIGNATPSDGYGTPNSKHVAADSVFIGQAVQKYGRTTSLTLGTVDAINATVNISYDNGTARFVNQIIIIPGSFIDSGDSGSLAVTNDGNKYPVALLFAGGPTIAIGNPIEAVLTRFGVTIDGEVSPDGPPPGVFTLTATGFKVKGVQHADLDWTGAPSNATFEVIRDGIVINSVSGTDDNGIGAYSDNIGQKGGGVSYIYQVCETETNTVNCSDEATVAF